MSRVKFTNTRFPLAVSYVAESRPKSHSALFFAVTNNSIYATTAYLTFGNRLTYARWGVSLYAGYSHMRMAAVIICLWSRYGGRKPFYAAEWGNDRQCLEMADTVILEGQRAGGSGCCPIWRGGLCLGSHGNLRAGRCFFLHSVPDLYQSILPIARNP